MAHDMQLLQGLWKHINCESPMGADDPDTVRQRAQNVSREQKRVQMARARACETARKYHAEGKQLPKGLANFLKGINIGVHILNPVIGIPLRSTAPASGPPSASDRTATAGPAALTISELLRNRIDK